MVLWSDVLEVAYTHWASWTFTASHSSYEESSDCASKEHSVSCLTKVARPCCLLKMCAARMNSGIVSFSVVSQCVCCSNMAVTLLIYASCSMMVSLTLVRPSTFNCCIEAPSPPTTAAAPSEKSSEQGSLPRIWFSVLFLGLVSCHRH